MKNLFILLSFLLPLAAGAQKKQPFKAYIYNKMGKTEIKNQDYGKEKDKIY